MKILDLKNVNKSFSSEYGDLEVLKDINLEVNKGEIVALIGPSGSGKSTLLNIISGLLEVSSGEVELYGEIGYMFQHDHLFKWRTVWKNILLGLEIKKDITEEREKYLKGLLEKYGLIDFIDSYPQQLSGGMRQRIALIRTLATKPSLLLLDEPFSALDSQTRIKVSDDIYKMIKDEGVSVVLVTHDIAEAISLADKVVILSHRPASLKKVIEINEFEENSLPSEKRKQEKFSSYFSLIWSVLNE